MGVRELGRLTDKVLHARGVYRTHGIFPEPLRRAGVSLHTPSRRQSAMGLRYIIRLEHEQNYIDLLEILKSGFVSFKVIINAESLVIFAKNGVRVRKGGILEGPNTILA
jgi:hypothetical protein